MEENKKRIALLVFLVAIVVLLIYGKIDDFPVILGFYTLGFLAYFYVVERIKWKELLFVGLALRCLAIFCFPGLSDDIYRFLWDGWLVTEGINPYGVLPMDVGLEMGGYHKELLEKMNSPAYFSVYPPVLQGIFASAVYFIPESIYGQMIYIKSLCLLAEIGTLVLGGKIVEEMGFKKERIGYYFLNPLVIVELLGNMHMEVLMIFGFAVFLWGLQKQRSWIWSVIGLAFSVGSKLVSVLVTPILLKKKSGWGIKEILIFGLLLGILMLPMVWVEIGMIGKGLDLYFQKFEFNASVYYLFRELGYLWKGYNMIAGIGPLLGVITGGTILYMAYKTEVARVGDIARFTLWSLTIYYMLSTTVHPWYISLMVFISVFTSLRFAYLWSMLAVLSYAKYYGSGDWYYVLVGVEYLLLWAFIVYELGSVKAKAKQVVQ